MSAAAILAAGLLVSEFTGARADEALETAAEDAAAAVSEEPAAEEPEVTEDPAQEEPAPEEPAPEEPEVTEPDPTEAPTPEPTEAPTEDPAQTPTETPAEDPAQPVDPADPAPHGYALSPSTGESVPVSDAAQALIDSGSISLDKSGYLVSQGKDGKTYLVDPTTGEVTDKILSADEQSVDEKKEDKSSDVEVVAYQPSQKELENIDSSPKSTNAKLIANQTIVKLPASVSDFRFWTVSRNYAFAKSSMSILEEKKDSAAGVGKLAKNGLMYVLKDEEDGWLYVESGDARGFVRADAVLQGDAAETEILHYRDKAMLEAALAGKTYSGIEAVVPTATDAAAPEENDAYFYLRATVQNTVIDKVYAISASDCNIREEQKDGARTIGTMKKGNLCYVIKDAGNGWLFVESGDARGFVKSSEVNTGSGVQNAVAQAGEDSYDLAEEKVKPADNAACYYTLTSIQAGVPDGTIRNSMLEYAAGFVGNPYVWGGTSLTDGADCSGFVQQIYAAYGYDIPRTSAEQSQCGTKIAVEDAEPGDLIFYAKDGVIFHVVMYAGDGLTIEAMSEDYGIVQSTVNEASAVWACRIIDDTESELTLTGGIDEVNATEDMYGEDLGEFTLTYYCNCEICCGQWANGATATGTPVVEGKTIAVDPSVIPYGTQVIIGGHVFTAEDCGSGIDGNRIDIYVNDHNYANQLGENTAEVYLVK